MKTILLLLSLLTLASCSKNCDDEKQQLYNDYQRALSNASTEYAIMKVKQDYENRLNKLNCD